MAKITGVIFNGGEQIICTGELSAVIDARLKEAEEKKPERTEKKPKEKN